MKKGLKCTSLVFSLIKLKYTKYIPLIFLIFSFIISCKKKEQENNTTTTLDQLSDSQIQTIEAAGVDTVSTFKDALFPDGTNMSKWESRNDSGHVQVFGREHPASDKRLLFIDNFTNAAFKLITRSNYNFQGQKGLAYVYGSNSFSNPSNYPGATCQQLLYGLDCSGMIYEMAKASDLNIPYVGTVGYVKTTTWNTAFDNSIDFQGLEMTDLQNLEPSQIQAGDIIVASEVHMGMVFNNGTSLGIFNSLGRSKYPCSKNSDKDHGPVITKNLLNWLKTTFGTNYHVLRVVQNGKPGLSTTDISSKTSTSAISGGDITNQGGSAITAKGVCWSTSPNPTIALPTKTSDGTGTLPFTSSITNLTANTTYYVKAYATNSAGTAYGNEVIFKATDNSTIQLNGATYTLISWRYGATIPGLVNFQAPANTPVYSYTPIQTFFFKTTTEYVHTDYDGLNRPSNTTIGSYKTGSYFPDSLFISSTGNATNTYAHQFKEGWGLKLPPGYELNIAGYIQSRISKDGQYLYVAQAGDRVFKRN